MGKILLFQRVLIALGERHTRPKIITQSKCKESISVENWVFLLDIIGIYVCLKSVFTHRSSKFFLPPFSSLKSCYLVNLILSVNLIFIFLYFCLSKSERTRKWCHKPFWLMAEKLPKFYSLFMAYSLDSLQYNSRDFMIFYVFCLLPSTSVLHESESVSCLLVSGSLWLHVL